jgi:hypothetical protein
MFRLYAATVLIASSAVSTASAQVKLEWKFKEGETFYIETEAKTKQSLDFGTEPLESESTTTDLNQYKVVKTNSQNAILEMQSMGSKSKGEDPIGKIGVALAKNLKDVTFRITLDKSGKATKVEGLDELIKKIVGNDAGTEKAVLLLGMEELYSEGLTQFFGFLPSKGVTKGDKWKRSGKMPLPMMGTLKCETEFEYQGPIEKGEKITSTEQFTYELPKAQEGALMHVTKADVKVESGKGTILFDAAAGRLVRSEQSLKLKGKLTMTSGKSGKEANLTVNIETDTVTRLLSENPWK